MAEVINEGNEVFESFVSYSLDFTHVGEDLAKDLVRVGMGFGRNRVVMVG